MAVKNYLEDRNEPSDAKLAKFIPQNQEFFTLEPDGLLVHFAASHPKRGALITQWVTPEALKLLVLRMCHDDGSAQHPSTAATHAKVFENFYWRGMGADIRDYVGYIFEVLGDVLEGEVAEGPNEVFRHLCVHREIGAEPATVADGTSAAQERLHALDHVLVTGVDPGQGVQAEAVTGAEYREWAKSVRNEEGEVQRRVDN
ncbi:hypothetical protein JKP88DRAFT_275292 [Tribonema minus]|uniref:Integrase zinc-binding domain-containing protein n=1 Tax=Tribonema minus TaxID=303371 RepID=A0A836CM48_9STRA|nr:hypothetical protein JKP88DRAFT_275292 [Tribonema minus]